MTRASAALFLGASAMFANMYSTQAILPAVERGLHVSAAVAGLSITLVVLGVAAGAWVHGPLSDRTGRARVMVCSAALIVLPTGVLGLAPAAPEFLALRFVQGLLMPGLLVVAVPYVSERFQGRAAGVAMGAYTSSLVFGGLVGRVGTALLTDAAGWRWGLAALTVPTALGAVAMAAWLPRDRPHPRPAPLTAAISSHVRTPALLLNAAGAGATFFGFVGIFTYATYRLTSPAIGLSLGQAGLVYGVWLVGALTPAVGGAAHRLGPSRVLPLLAAAAGIGAALTMADRLILVVAGLALMAGSMFSTVTSAQLLIPRLARHSHGAATSLHLTIYYVLGGAGAYVPGLVLGSGWPAVVAVCEGALVFALLCALGVRLIGARAAAPAGRAG